MSRIYSSDHPPPFLTFQRPSAFVILRRKATEWLSSSNV
jgi:hypothetical protein